MHSTAIMVYLCDMHVDWSTIGVRLTPRICGRTRWPRGVRVLSTWDGVTNDQDLWYVFAGRGRISTRGGHVALQPGMVCWMRPGWVYSITQEPEEPLGMNFIHFELVDTNGSVRRPDAPLPPEVIFPSDVHLAEAVTTRVVELFPRHVAPHQTVLPLGEEIATRLFTGLLMHLDAEGDLPATAALGSTQRRHRELAMAVAAKMRDTPASSIDIAELAIQGGYSREHFSRVFKAVTGHIPEGYRVEARLSRARELLTDTDLTVKEIAGQLGYRNEHFFSRQFKEKAGSSPTAFRTASGKSRRS